jgi:hypothetical protein
MPANWNGFQSNFFGMFGEFPGALKAALDLIRSNVDAVQADLESGNEALHGSGAEGSGTVLQVGTGLSVRVVNQYFWVSGVRYRINEQAGYLVASVPAGKTSHLYMDAARVVTPYLQKPGERPSGTWYLGTATANDVSCTAVDFSGCDRVSSLVVLNAAVAALEAAVGMPYTLEGDLQTLMNRILTGQQEGQDPISWGTLQKLFGVDPTTVDQQIAADLSDHVEEYHGQTGGGSGGEVTLLLQRWNSEATRNGRLSLLIGRLLIPYLFEHLPDCAEVIWGVSGQGNYDAVNSTWVPEPSPW